MLVRIVVTRTIVKRNVAARQKSSVQVRRLGGEVEPGGVALEKVRPRNSEKTVCDERRKAAGETRLRATDHICRNRCR
jgi:hypothetical protein